MDTGQIKNDFTYYKGFEGEGEVTFTYAGLCLHVWDGYIFQIVGKPPLDGKGWHGMTRDYNQLEGPWDEDEADVDAVEYLQDLKHYQGKHLETAQAEQVLSRLIELFRQAAAHGAYVHIEVY